MGSYIVILKNLLKSSLDNYVLPGTLSGTEILWLYLLQWKRDITVAVPAFLLMIASYQSTRVEEIASPLNIDPERTDNLP